MKVLIIDDDADIRMIVSLALTQEGWDLTEAADGTAGLARAAEAPFDVILLDHMLPDQHGTEVLEKLRGTPELASVPVIFLTAKVDASDLASAQGVLTKPFDPFTLKDRIEEILASGPG